MRASNMCPESIGRAGVKEKSPMKRMHVHVSVNDLAESVRFYATLFKAEPAVIKEDYAKWMLDDPRVNFAISTRGEARGLDHLGIQGPSQRRSSTTKFADHRG
jgi:hypothetical protein